MRPSLPVQIWTPDAEDHLLASRPPRPIALQPRTALVLVLWHLVVALLVGGPIGAVLTWGFPTARTADRGAVQARVVTFGMTHREQRTSVGDSVTTQTSDTCEMWVSAPTPTGAVEGNVVVPDDWCNPEGPVRFEIPVVVDGAAIRLASGSAQRHSNNALSTLLVLWSLGWGTVLLVRLRRVRTHARVLRHGRVLRGEVLDERPAPPWGGGGMLLRYRWSDGVRRRERTVRAHQRLEGSLLVFVDDDVDVAHTAADWRVAF